MTALQVRRAPEPAVRAPSPDRAWMRKLHVLLGMQSLVLVLLSLNRLSGVTDAAVLPHGSLRLVELVNLVVLPPAGALATYLLLEHVLGGAAARTRRLLRVLFLAALYAFALGYGMHEPANYLHGRFCADDAGELCRIVAYQDDELSHAVFFAGFAGMDLVLLAAQAAAPAAIRLSGRDLAIVLANGSVVAAAIVANLAFEDIGLDLAVVAGVAVVAVALMRRHGRRPLLVYFAWAYVAGLAITAAASLA